MKPAILKGWDIPKEEYRKAHEKNGLVKVVIELSNVCNLSCSGCFTKRVDGGWSDTSKKRLSNEMTFEDQVALLQEAAQLGAKTVDIVGAGEPTLDPRFHDIIDAINSLGMYAVVFTHGVSRVLEDMREWRDRDVSFFVKLWSRDTILQDRYVSGSIPKYTKKRDETIERMVQEGLNKGADVDVDGIAYITTKIGADVLVMQSNYEEIPALLQFCRARNIMPIIKTYIPEGPTRFDQEQNIKVYSAEQLVSLKKDEVSPNDFVRLRKELERVDMQEFRIAPTNTFYPQALKCTQSMAALYVTITGDIRSCVGTHVSYGMYEPGKDLLHQALANRKERVGFGCMPRLEDTETRGLRISPELKRMYEDGI